MAAEADNFVGTVKDGVSLMEPKAAETTAPSANFAEEKTPSSEAVCREQRCEGKCSNWQLWCGSVQEK
jgi:hypothetical protein